MSKVVSRVLLAAAAALVLGGCSSGGGGDGSGFLLDGSIKDLNPVVGKLAYIKLVTPGAGDAAPAIYWTVSTPFDAGNEATYSISGIAEGTYDRFIFVDRDGDSGGGAGAMPDSGDDGTGPDSFTFPPDNIDVIAGGFGTWITVP